MIDDVIADNDFFGADSLLISSASSKTAIGAARLAHDRGAARVIGLTSEGNRSFVEGLGCYDDVVLYDSVGGLTPSSAVFVDIAGNRDVLSAVHSHFEGNLTHSMLVGGTHWDHQPATDAALVGPEPSFFFAPAQIAKRASDWGHVELNRRVGEAWQRFSEWTDSWLELRRADGPDAVEAAYRTLLEGRAHPREGYVCSMA
jgi:NADPH:quinone reductase-like Zn-dependent oxidoreductase